MAKKRSDVEVLKACEGNMVSRSPKQSGNGEQQRGEWCMADWIQCLLVIAVSTAAKASAAGAGLMYHSTDMEVHRHWTSVTYHEPMVDWYPASGSCSIWSMDYPPFFALFQAVIAGIAHAVIELASYWSGVDGGDILGRDGLWRRELAASVRWSVKERASALQYDLLEMLQPFCATAEMPMGAYSTSATVFLRLTVVMADLMLAYGALRACKSMMGRCHGDTGIYGIRKSAAVLTLVLLNAGLLMIDHMHFQYNGFLIGICLLGIAFLLEDRPHLAAVTFAFLVNTKHLFLCVCPVVFIYMFSRYCCKGGRLCPGKTASLSVVGCLVFALALGPLASTGQLKLLMARLFPFQRGLCHAYWAPNFWALYTGVDMVLARLLSRATTGFTGGLVGDESSHAVLPSVGSRTCAALVLLSLLPLLVLVWKQPTRRILVPAVSLAGLSMFFFGFHTHEKAILVVTVPLTLAIFGDASLGGLHLLLAIVGHVSLAPLLFDAASTVLSAEVQMVYVLAQVLLLSGQPVPFGRVALVVAGVYLTGLIVVYGFWAFGHMLLLGDRLPFLPLMLMSCYCAVGVAVLFIALYHRTFVISQQGKEKAE